MYDKLTLTIQYTIWTLNIYCISYNIIASLENFVRARCQKPPHWLGPLWYQSLQPNTFCVMGLLISSQKVHILTLKPPNDKISGKRAPSWHSNPMLQGAMHVWMVVGVGHWRPCAIFYSSWLYFLVQTCRLLQPQSVSNTNATRGQV